MNIDALMCSTYVKTHDADLYLSVVLTDESGKAVYSRTLEALRGELTDGEENALLDSALCARLDSAFTADMLRNELIEMMLTDNATNQHDDSYGVLLHSMNNITHYYNVLS